MPRSTKPRDQRLGDLLDAAIGLFSRKGYEKTSINDITDEAGVAKGTFYLYFKSKQDLLGALATRFVESSLQKTKAAVKQAGPGGVEKLKGFFAAACAYKLANARTMKVLVRALSSEENVLLRNELMQRSIELELPELNKIIHQGVRAGVFRPELPDQIGELILRLGDSVSYDMRRYAVSLDEHPANIAILLAKAKAYEYALERILGVPEGSLQLYDEATFEAFMKGRGL